MAALWASLKPRLARRRGGSGKRDAGPQVRTCARMRHIAVHPLQQVDLSCAVGREVVPRLQAGRNQGKRVREAGVAWDGRTAGRVKRGAQGIRGDRGNRGSFGAQALKQRPAVLRE